MAKILIVFAAAVLSAQAARGAFEPVPQSPWLQSGIASSLFPRSPLAIGCNPAAAALLEEAGLAVSASRPFGLRRLDRTSLAGFHPFGAWSAGGVISVSGDDAYTEISAEAACAWRLLPRVAAAAGLSINRLQISGYGRATGTSLDLSLVWSPSSGIYSTALARGLLRTDLGDSGDPAAPRSIEFAVGAVPASNVTVAAGVSGQEGLDMEFSGYTSFSPVEALCLGAGILTRPARFWVSVELSISTLGLQYGYAEHSSLPGTSSIALSWGRSAFRPETLDLGGEEAEAEDAATFPINVNTATEEQLEQIPGIGPSRASAIAAYVIEHGPVASVESLQDVPGIGPSLIRVLSGYLVAE